MRAALLAVPAIVAFSTLLMRLPESRRVQFSEGRDVLDVAFADARGEIARMMVRKADSYYHGGLEVSCSHHDGEPCEECAHAGHAHEGARRDSCGGMGTDPWRWINVRIRAPEGHVHLVDAQSVELLPWYWAAVRAAPHDVELWTTTIFIAWHDLKDDALAERLLAEARERNPQSAEIAFAEGRFRGRGARVGSPESRAAFERARALLEAKGELSDNDLVLRNLIDAFLQGGR